MKTIYLESFERDIKKIKERGVKKFLIELIGQIKASQTINVSSI
jgi:hypothetical protein